MWLEFGSNLMLEFGSNLMLEYGSNLMLGIFDARHRCSVDAQSILCTNSHPLKTVDRGVCCL